MRKTLITRPSTFIYSISIMHQELFQWSPCFLGLTFQVRIQGERGGKKNDRNDRGRRGKEGRGKENKDGQEDQIHSTGRTKIG